MPQQVVRVDDNGNPIQSGAMRVDDDGNPIKEKPPDDGGFFHWGSRPSERKQAEATLAARGNGPVRASAPREDTQVLGMPPELVPLVALKGVMPAARAVRAGVGVAGKIGPAITAAAPAIKYQVTKSALEAIGASPTVATTIATAVSMRGGGGRAAAAEAPLSAEGQALAKAGRSSSGIPARTPVGASPRGGAITVPSPAATTSGSGLPARTPMGSSPTTGAVTVPSPALPPRASGSGMPARIPLRVAPQGGSVEIAESRLAPRASGSGVPSRISTAATPTGGSIPDTRAAAIKAVEAPKPVKMPAPKAVAAPDALPKLTRTMLTPEERTAFDQMVSEGHAPKMVYEHLSKLRQTERLAAMLKAKLGGS